MYHGAYIIGSVLAAILASAGVWMELPVLYGPLPGVIGAVMLAIASVRFFKGKKDLAGFIATFCGFVYYQAYQANPVMLPEFTGYLIPIPKQDQVVGIALANLTTAILLVSYRVMRLMARAPIQAVTPDPLVATHARMDRAAMVGFCILFALVATPNVLFGKVVVGAYRNIVYQRLAWTGDADFSGFEVWGGAVGGSVANMALGEQPLSGLALPAALAAQGTYDDPIAAHPALDRERCPPRLPDLPGDDGGGDRRLRPRGPQDERVGRGARRMGHGAPIRPRSGGLVLPD